MPDFDDLPQLPDVPTQATQQSQLTTAPAPSDIFNDLPSPMDSSLTPPALPSMANVPNMPVTQPVQQAPQKLNLNIDGRPYSINWGADRDPTPAEVTDISNQIRKEDGLAMPTNDPRDSGNWRTIYNWALTQGFQGSRNKAGQINGFDPTGKGHNQDSLHYSGNALDISLHGKTPDQVNQFMQAAKQAGYNVLDERQRLPGEQNWNGGHIHLSWTGKAPVNDIGDSGAHGAYSTQGLGFAGQAMAGAQAYLGTPQPQTQAATPPSPTSEADFHSTSFTPGTQAQQQRLAGNPQYQKWDDAPMTDTLDLNAAYLHAAKTMGTAKAQQLFGPALHSSDLATNPQTIGQVYKDFQNLTDVTSQGINEGAHNLYRNVFSFLTGQYPENVAVVGRTGDFLTNLASGAATFPAQAIAHPQETGYELGQTIPHILGMHSGTITDPVGMWNSGPASAEEFAGGWLNVGMGVKGLGELADAVRAYRSNPQAINTMAQNFNTTPEAIHQTLDNIEMKALPVRTPFSEAPVNVLPNDAPTTAPPVDHYVPPQYMTREEFQSQEFGRAKEQAQSQLDQVQQLKNAKDPANPNVDLLSGDEKRAAQGLQGDLKQLITSDKAPDWFNKDSDATHQVLIRQALERGEQIPQPVLDSHPGVFDNEIPASSSSRGGNATDSQSRVQPITSEGPDATTSGGRSQEVQPSLFGRPIEEPNSAIRPNQPATGTNVADQLIPSPQPESVRAGVQPNESSVSNGANPGPNATSGLPPEQASQGLNDVLQAQQTQLNWLKSTNSDPKAIAMMEKAVSDTQAQIDAGSGGGGKPQADQFGSKNKLVTPEEYAQIKARRDAANAPRKGGKQSGAVQKLSAQDLKDAARAAIFHIEGGARAFAEFGTRMITDFGNGITPYLRKMYIAAKAAAGDPVSRLVRIVDQAPQVMREKAADISTQKSGRVKLAQDALTGPGTGKERLGAARAQLTGAYNGPDFEPVGNKLAPHEIDEIYNRIADHPTLSPLDKTNAESALDDTLAGKVPQHYDLTQLSKALGNDLASSLLRKGEPRQPTFLENINRFRRAMMLTSPDTLGKLVSFSHQHMVSEALSDVLFTPARWLGGKYSYTEIGSVPKADLAMGAKYAQVWKEMFTEGKDSEIAHTLKTGRNYLDEGYGMPEHWGESPLDKPSWMDIMQRVHAAEKAPLQEAAFQRSLVKQAAVAQMKGIDLANPSVVTEMHIRAYNDSLQAVLKNDNAVTTVLSKILKDQPQKNFDKADLTKFAVESQLPFTKVPINYAGRVAEHVYGAAYGPLRAGLTALVNLKTEGRFYLTPEQAETCLRATRRGSFGLGLMMVGYYQPHLLDNVPSFLQHGPLLAPVSIGSAIRNEEEQAGGKPKIFMSDRESGSGIIKPKPEGYSPLVRGLWKGSTNTVQQMPLVTSGSNLINAATSQTPTTAGKFAGQYLGSFIPALSKDIAKGVNDRNLNPDGGDQNYRTPKGFLDELKLPVPGLRGQVPTKADSKKAKLF